MMRLAAIIMKVNTTLFRDWAEAHMEPEISLATSGRWRNPCLWPKLENSPSGRRTIVQLPPWCVTSNKNVYVV